MLWSDETGSGITKCTRGLMTDGGYLLLCSSFVTSGMYVCICQCIRSLFDEIGELFNLHSVSS